MGRASSPSQTSLIMPGADPASTCSTPSALTIPLPQTSHVMSELHLLRELTGTDDMSMRRLVENWFSVQKSRWLYSMFLELDADEDGLLSADDFARVPVCRLSPLFVARLFEGDTTARPWSLGAIHQGDVPATGMLSQGRSLPRRVVLWRERPVLDGMQSTRQGRGGGRRVATGRS